LATSRTQNLAARWQTSIASGQTVTVAQAELLPLKDVKIKLLFDPQTSSKDLMTTALYVSTNTIYRDVMKKEIWTELAAGMKAKQMPAPLIEHGEKGVGPAIDMALDKQVGIMASAIQEEKPLVTDEDVKVVKEYQAKKAAENPPKDLKPDEQNVDDKTAIDGDGSKPIQSSDVRFDATPGAKDASALGVVEREEAPAREQFERDQAIRVEA
jgi:hypothetical protein